MPEALPLIISVDDHVVEPANVWQDRLPAKYAEVGPRIVRAPMGEITFVGGKLTVTPGSEGLPTDWWYYEDLKRPLLRVDSAVGVPREEVTMRGVTYEDMRPGSYEVKPRLEDMDLNHIEAALCFPTFPRFCGQTFTEAKDKELGAALRAGLQRLDGRGVVRRLRRAAHPPVPDPAVGRRDGGDRSPSQCRPGRPRRVLQRDPALPRAAQRARPRALLGPVLPGLRRDRAPSSTCTSARRPRCPRRRPTRRRPWAPP